MRKTECTKGVIKKYKTNKLEYEKPECVKWVIKMCKTSN